MLIVGLPPILVAGIAVVLDSRGPVFYRQPRVGLFGEPYDMYKIRSMRTDAEAEGKAVWASENDPRITRVGRIIRTLRIDELPQLWCVLKGEMSFVGPRPERPSLSRSWKTAALLCRTAYGEAGTDSAGRRSITPMARRSRMRGSSWNMTCIMRKIIRPSSTC